jgi:hypothetical protein
MATEAKSMTPSAAAMRQPADSEKKNGDRSMSKPMLTRYAIFRNGVGGGNAKEVLQ